MRVVMAPAWLYQRYRVVFDRLVPALAMAVMFLSVAQATGTFLDEWRLFIAAVVLVAGLITPVAGYVLFVLSLVIPLYAISVYVAALALAVLVPPIFFLTRYLAVVVVVLATPLLASCWLAPLVPFLVGLWWAEWEGSLAGVASALWLKIFAGMCEATPDLMRLGGQSWATQRLVTRFQTANSLETLFWLVEPLAPNPQMLLLHILQVLGWGLAGYGVGLLHQRTAGMPRRGVGLLASAGAGLLGLGIGSVGLPLALGLPGAADIPVSFLVECLLGAGLAVGAYAVSLYLTCQVVREPAGAPIEPLRAPVHATSEPEPGPRVQPRPRDEEQADVIMIDLD